jgi:hypothetical protein
MFKICSDCIKDLQGLRSREESKYRSLLYRPSYINCPNRPRCFDQPERSKQEDIDELEKRKRTSTK